MPQFSPSHRAAAIGIGAAALLVGAFAVGLSQSSEANAEAATATGQQQGAQSGAGRITVTGTGTVTGTPNQLVLSMGVQVNGGSVSAALAQANQVTESLTATLRQLDKAGQQIQAAADAGGNAITVSNVSLNLTDDGPLLAIARANAMKDARAKAEQFATAAGEQLGQIISITPVGGSSPPMLNQMASVSAGSATVPISPGSQQVSVSVTVVYAV